MPKLHRRSPVHALGAGARDTRNGGFQDGVEWDASSTLPQVLGEQGYQTALIGRSMDQHPARKRYGFDEMEFQCHIAPSESEEWLRLHGPSDSGEWFGGGVLHNDWTARPWPLPDDLHFTNFVVTRALRWLERRDPSCPFFLTLGFVAPHPPLQPAAFHFECYLRTGVPERVIAN